MRKFILLYFLGCILQLPTQAQGQDVNIKSALLIIDIQNFYFPGGSSELVNVMQASEVAKDVLQLSRKNQILVVHVRHLSKKGFEIYKDVEPLPDEKIITKTEVNSFLGTDLLAYLKENGINRLIIIGMQTHMCLEGAVRSGHDYGFDCVVVEDACATRDLVFGEKKILAADVHASTLASLRDGGYARIIKFSDLQADTQKYLNKPKP